MHLEMLNIEARRLRHDASGMLARSRGGDRKVVDISLWWAEPHQLMSTRLQRLRR